MHSHEKVYAAIRIVPLSYGSNSACDHYVIERRHFSFQAAMLQGKLDEIKETIVKEHGDSLHITQSACDREVLLTLGYHPDYFNFDTNPQTFRDFLCWIESMWWSALADYHRVTTRARSQC